MTGARTVGIDWTPGEVPVLLGLSAVAIFGCVPETSDQMPAIGVFLVALFIAEVVPRRPLGAGAHAISAAIVLWSGLYGASGRDSAAVGALFALWPPVLVVLVAHWPGRTVRTPWVRWVVGLIGGTAAIIVARTGALEPTIGPALLAVAIAAPASLAAALAVEPISRRAARRR